MENLNKIAPRAKAELGQAQLEAGKQLADAIRARAPARSGRYRQTIQAARLAERGRTGSAVAASTKDENAVGIYALFIWKFLEFGTVKQRAQPHIFPTYRANKKQIRVKMSGAVRKAIKQAVAGG